MSETLHKPEFNHFKGTAGYIASDALMEAVNCAIALERPLLIKGEPGTGKTLLATHTAEALGMPMESWHVKSTSKASEGLYVYDTIQRLNDARFGDGDVGDIRAYIKLGPLGRTFKAKERHVLLIDEIDKADMEFPNDLLLELDEMRFTVMETGDEIAAKERPVVMITSNNEKELPDAFLRRCIFHFIDFPDVELMKQIVRRPPPEPGHRVARPGAHQVLLATRPERVAQETLDLRTHRLDLGVVAIGRDPISTRGPHSLPGIAAEERARYGVPARLREQGRQPTQEMGRPRTEVQPVSSGARRSDAVDRMNDVESYRRG